MQEIGVAVRRYTLETHVAFTQLSSAIVEEKQEAWGGNTGIGKSVAGALWVVRHDLNVDGPGT